MRKYLLDTDIITYLEEKDSPFHASVKSRLSSLADLSSTSIEYDLIIVSNDGIFQKINELFPKLKVENWSHPPVS